MLISSAQQSDYNELVEVWESAVRATHHFLSESDIVYFKPLVRDEFLSAVTLAVARNSQGHILGFIGVAGPKIEMLFVRPEFHGLGIGKLLIQHAITHLKVNAVDVNEQNEQAVGFYQRFGFRIEGRSALDSMGKPFPLLHMKFHGSQEEISAVAP